MPTREEFYGIINTIASTAPRHMEQQISNLYKDGNKIYVLHKISATYMIEENQCREMFNHASDEPPEPTIVEKG
jgi:hypothetical protein